MTNVSYYYEECNKSSMPFYPFFLEKILTVQKLCPKIYTKKTIPNDNYRCVNGQNDICTLYTQSKIESHNNSCENCKITKFYKLGNIIWSNILLHKISNHHFYPSEYFIKIILAIVINNNYIINPPLEINPKYIDQFVYIPLHYNKLLIIDALMFQGSFPRYVINKTDGTDDYIYSEHSGVISIKNSTVDNIIVSAETNRLDANDKSIYLPINTQLLKDHIYLFHTHPNTKTYGGRIKEGIVYEFPSANDIFNFVKYHNKGKAQASIIVAPEGIYVIRPIYVQPEILVDSELFDNLRKFILKLERVAIKKIKPFIGKISDPDFFHSNIGSNFSFVKLYNNFIEPFNLFIEYYPRIKKNGEWSLRQINLPYLKKKQVKY